MGINVVLTRNSFVGHNMYIKRKDGVLYKYYTAYEYGDGHTVISDDEMDDIMAQGDTLELALTHFKENIDVDELFVEGE